MYYIYTYIIHIYIYVHKQRLWDLFSGTPSLDPFLSAHAAEVYFQNVCHLAAEDEDSKTVADSKWVLSIEVACGLPSGVIKHGWKIPELNGGF